MTDSVGNNSELRQSAEQLRHDNSPALQILVTSDGQPLAVNLAGRRLVGSPAVTEWEDLLAADDLSRWKDLVRTALNQQVPLSAIFRLRRFDKALRQFVLRAEQRYCDAGLFAGLVVSGMDITDLAGPESASAAEPKSSERQNPWPQEALRWHDELVSVATIVAGCADILSTLLQDAHREEVREVLSRLQSATGILRSTVAELSSTGRTSASHVVRSR